MRPFRFHRKFLLLASIALFIYGSVARNAAVANISIVASILLFAFVVSSKAWWYLTGKHKMLVRRGCPNCGYDRAKDVGDYLQCRRCHHKFQVIGDDEYVYEPYEEFEGSDFWEAVYILLLIAAGIYVVFLLFG